MAKIETLHSRQPLNQSDHVFPSTLDSIIATRLVQTGAPTDYTPTQAGFVTLLPAIDTASQQTNRFTIRRILKTAGATAAALLPACASLPGAEQPTPPPIIIVASPTPDRAVSNPGVKLPDTNRQPVPADKQLTLKDSGLEAFSEVWNYQQQLYTKYGQIEMPEFFDANLQVRRGQVDITKEQETDKILSLTNENNWGTKTPEQTRADAEAFAASAAYDISDRMDDPNEQRNRLVPSAKEIMMNIAKIRPLLVLAAPKDILVWDYNTQTSRDGRVGIISSNSPGRAIASWMNMAVLSAELLEQPRHIQQYVSLKDYQTYAREYLKAELELAEKIFTAGESEMMKLKFNTSTGEYEPFFHVGLHDDTAKTERDQEMNDLEQSFAEFLTSGYGQDSVTSSFRDNPVLRMNYLTIRLISQYDRISERLLIANLTDPEAPEKARKQELLNKLRNEAFRQIKLALDAPDASREPQTTGQPDRQQPMGNFGSLWSEPPRDTFSEVNRRMNFLREQLASAGVDIAPSEIGYRFGRPIDGRDVATLAEYKQLPYYLDMFGAAKKYESETIGNTTYTLYELTYNPHRGIKTSLLLLAQTDREKPKGIIITAPEEAFAEDQTVFTPQWLNQDRDTLRIQMPKTQISITGNLAESTQVTIEGVEPPEIESMVLAERPLFFHHSLGHRIDKAFVIVGGVDGQGRQDITAAHALVTQIGNEPPKVRTYSLPPQMAEPNYTYTTLVLPGKTGSMGLFKPEEAAIDANIPYFSIVESSLPTFINWERKKATYNTYNFQTGDNRTFSLLLGDREDEAFRAFYDANDGRNNQLQYTVTTYLINHAGGSPSEVRYGLMVTNPQNGNTEEFPIGFRVNPDNVPVSNAILLPFIEPKELPPPVAPQLDATVIPISYNKDLLDPRIPIPKLKGADTIFIQRG